MTPASGSGVTALGGETGAPGSQSRGTRDSSATGEDSRTILRVEGLRVRFGGLQAVAGTTFAVRRGTITGLIGPNGAGKSTVVNSIAGQVRTATGSIVFEDQELLGRKPEQISRLGLRRTFQTANLFSRMTVMENLLLGAPPWEGEHLRASFVGRGKWHRHEAVLVRKALAIMEEFGVVSLADELASTLSGGQKRIVEIMRSLMGEPAMLLLDEPMAGINPSLARTIGDHLLKLRDAGVSMLMIEHNLGLVEQLCDPVIVMAQGTVLSQGSLSELRKDEEVVNAYLAG